MHTCRRDHREKREEGNSSSQVMERKKFSNPTTGGYLVGSGALSLHSITTPLPACLLHCTKRCWRTPHPLLPQAWQ